MQLAHIFALTAVSLVHVCSVSGAPHAGPIPIVLWHGIGDNCCAPGSIGGFKNFLEMNIPNVYVKSVMIGSDPMKDKWNSYFLRANRQVDIVCNQLQQDPKLQSGFHAVGFSQGGLLMRAVVQRCPKLQIKNLVTFGAPHQGVYGYPSCDVSKTFCEYLRRFLSHFIYHYIAQIAYVPLQYWQDPLDMRAFAKGSIFLSDINNVKNFKKEYKDNLMKLNKFVMVRFLKDGMVTPSESSWFGFYRPGQTKVVLPFNETVLYTTDMLGLKELHAQGKLVFLSQDAPHMYLNYTWIKDQIVKYLV